MKSCDFYCKRHILAWIHVDWAILHENRLRGLTSRAVHGGKTQKVSDSHRNDVSPLMQGLRYRAACDLTGIHGRILRCTLMSCHCSISIRRPYFVTMLAASIANSFVKDKTNQIANSLLKPPNKRACIKMNDVANIYKKAVLPQENRAMPQVFFSVEVRHRQRHSLQVRLAKLRKPGFRAPNLLAQNTI